jgi:triacylglycerol lipase
MQTLMLIGFGIMLGFALLTYGFFWYETANGPHLVRLRELSSQGRVGRLLLRGIVTSFGSQWLVVACYPLALWRDLWRPRASARSPTPPVLLVHGLYHNASAWVLYRWWLKRAGFTNVYAMSYNSLKYSFDDLAQRLDQWVAEVMANHPPEQKAFMIGHSLGGLLIRAHLTKPEAAQKIAAIATLGTPHCGSKLAALGIGKLAQSLIYHGALSRRLEQAPQPAGVARLALASPVDNLVLPQDALVTTQPGWIQEETPPVSHVAMLFHRPTARRVLAFFKQVTTAD